MKTLLTTSALAVMIVSAPAVAQTTMPAPTGQTGADQSTLNNGTMNNGTMNNGTMNNGTMNNGTMNNGTMAAPMDQTGANQGTMNNTVGVPTDQTGTSSGMNDSTMNNGTMGSTGSTTTMDQGMRTDGPTSPDGSKAFGIEPYFGVLGGYHSYDRITDSTGFRAPRFDGAQIEGIIGVNIPLGPLFVGVEGHGSYGFGDARWEYGVRGRGGARIGESGLVYASAGYMWTDVRNGRGFADRESWMWGIGVEAGPRDIGLGGVTGKSGPRFRVSVETADFDSLRPMAGVIFHF
jgi:opacity protein-like surface antigen